MRIALLLCGCDLSVIINAAVLGQTIQAIFVHQWGLQGTGYWSAGRTSGCVWTCHNRGYSIGT